MALDEFDKELIKALIGIHTEYLNEPIIPVGHRKEKAIFYAVEKGNCDLVSFLAAEYYGQSSKIHERGLSLLHRAVTNSDLNMARCLVELGCSAEQFAVIPEPLHHEFKKSFLGPHSPDATGTSLHVAATVGSLEIVQYFIEECKVAIDMATKSGETPLMRALQFGQEEVARYLIQQNASLTSIDKQDKLTLIHLVFLPFYLPMKKIKKPSIEFLKFLIEDCSLDIDSTDNNGDTPLHLAAHYGSVPAAKLLIELGADSSRRNNARRTPLDHAHFMKQQLAEKRLLTCYKNTYNHGPIIQYLSTKNPG